MLVIYLYLKIVYCLFINVFINMSCSDTCVCMCMIRFNVITNQCGLWYSLFNRVDEGCV